MFGPAEGGGVFSVNVIFLLFYYMTTIYALKVLLFAVLISTITILYGLTV